MLEDGEINLDNIYETVFTARKECVGHNAMLLAMTKTLESEKALKTLFLKSGIRFAVTEIGGKSDGALLERIQNSVIGASLNENLIDKTSSHIHAVLHATEEAKKGFLINGISKASVVAKIAIVRNEHWIAVAMFGESSFHPVSGHERCGLGVMHI